MNKHLKLKRLLGFQDFFLNEQPESKEFYAKKLGKELIEKFCCYFLSFFRHRNIPTIDDLLKEWFTFNDFKFNQSPSYWYIEGEYRRIKIQHPDEVHEIISVESLLNMFLWVYNRTDIPNTIEDVDASATLPLLRFYLLFNDDVLFNYEKVVESIKLYGENRKLQRLIFGMSFPQSDLINIDYAQLLYTQVFKAAKLISYIEKEIKYKSLFVSLLQEFKCSTKEEFFKAISGAIIQPLSSKQPGWNVLTTKNSVEKEKANYILERLAVNEGETIIDQDDYLFLRNKPFQKITSSEYRVVFDLFLIKKLYNGLIFKLSSYDKIFLGKIRTDFSEGILVYETLNDIFKPKTSILQEMNSKLISLKESRIFIQE